MAAYGSCRSISIGVVGGGQLGAMLAQESRKAGMPLDFVFLDPVPGCPASGYGRQIVAGLYDVRAIEELGRQCGILTCEIEHVSAEGLRAAERNGIPVYPSAETLKIIQDKGRQYELLKSSGLPVPDFRLPEKEEDLVTIGNDLGYPFMAKAATGGYDGRGNYTVKSDEDARGAWRHFIGRGIVAQKWVPFEKEVSVIAARDTTGNIASYPIRENHHKDGILIESVAPARINASVAKNAEYIGYAAARVFGDAGIICVEMFVLPDGQVYINEIAPRVHNSGHDTMDSCKTSQFEQHLRAITGMPLGSTEMLYPAAVMHNILGNPGYSGEYVMAIPDCLSEAGVRVHMYGKREVRPGRKMGHLAVVGDNPEELIKKSQEARRAIRFVPVGNGRHKI